MASEKGQEQCRRVGWGLSVSSGTSDYLFILLACRTQINCFGDSICMMTANETQLRKKIHIFLNYRMGGEGGF